MKLRNAIQVTGPYMGKSKFSFLTNLKAGDIIIISIGTNQKLQGASSGLYATAVHMKLKGTQEKFQASMTEFAKYLSKIPHQEYKEYFSRDEVKEMLEEVYMYSAQYYDGFSWGAFIKDAESYTTEYMKTK